MRRSEERILTTHTGSLPRPPELTRLYVRRARGESVDTGELAKLGSAALRYPIFRQMMEEQLAAREAVSNMGPPKAIGEVCYLGPAAIEAECGDFQAALDQTSTHFVEPFLTVPSPGIIASAMNNEYYDSEEAYLAALATALQGEYETIVRRGFLLQLD
jgi:5-methyltetrahydropteroyltriglutamate--homocysteine methyltransferase